MLRIIGPSTLPPQDLLEDVLVCAGGGIKSGRISIGTSPSPSPSLFESELEKSESVSLVRKFIQADPSWLAFLSSLEVSSVDPQDLRQMAIKRGVIGVLGGIPVSAQIGGFALLTNQPAASGETNRKAIGFGSEHVISGLQRQSLPSGIISKVSDSSASCEIIVANRAGMDSVDEPAFIGHTKDGGITVKALRCSVADVQLVPEFGLVLDPETGWPATEQLLSKCMAFYGSFKNRILFELISKDEHKAAIAKLATSNSAPASIDEQDSVSRFKIHQFINEMKTVTSESKTVEGKRIIEISASSDTAATQAEFSTSTAPLTLDAGSIEECSLYVSMMRACVTLLSSSSASPKPPAPDALHDLLSLAVQEIDPAPEDTSGPPKSRLMHLSLADLGKLEAEFVALTAKTKKLRSKYDAVFSMEKVLPSEEKEEPAAPPLSTPSPAPSITTPPPATPDLAEDEVERIAASIAAATINSSTPSQPPAAPSPRDLVTPPPTLPSAGLHNEDEEGEEEEEEEEEEDDDEENEDEEEQSILREEERRQQRDEEEEDAEEERRERERVLSQMVEMGFPPEWCELALRRSGGSVENAIHFCFERGGEMDALLEEEREAEDERQRRNAPSTPAAAAAADAPTPPPLEEEEKVEEEEEEETFFPRELVELGYPLRWAEEALGESPRSIKQAITYLNEHAERLAAEDCARLQGDAPVPSPSTPNPSSKKWTGKVVTPLRRISGESRVDRRTLECTGVPGGGFASVGTRGCVLKEGKWYYEVELLTAGCMQLGWADCSYRSNSDRGDGCGDGTSSWAYDGWRLYRWNKSAVDYGVKWKAGDVVGVGIDLDAEGGAVITYTINGQAEEIGMGVAFRGVKPCGGVFACLSFNRREKCKVVLEDCEHLPEGYRSVGEAIEAMGEGEGEIVGDFSGGETGGEIFAHQHRFFSKDASVHLGGGGGMLGRRGGGGDWVGSRSSKKSIADLSLGAATGWKEMKEERLNFFKESQQSALVDLAIVSYKLGVLYARRAFLGLVVKLGERFNLGMVNGDDELLFRLIKTCGEEGIGLTGEAGAMVLAAESLGLGCSGFSNREEGRGCGVLFLNSFTTLKGGRGEAAEFALGAGGGGLLTFLKASLQQVINDSAQFKARVVSTIKEIVVSIAGVKLDQVESEDDEEAELLRRTGGIGVGVGGGDLRLACWLSSLVKNEAKEELLAIWAMGLLSSSVSCWPDARGCWMVQ